MRILPALLAFTLLHGEAPQVREAPLRAHLAFLADDLLEGRGTGQRGGDLAVRYLETQAAGRIDHSLRSWSAVRVVGIR